MRGRFVFDILTKNGATHHSIPGCAEENQNEEHRYYDFRGEFDRTIWRYGDMYVIDGLHSWSIFTMYWPQLAFCALFGKE